jgi:hypothetical protein
MDPAFIIDAAKEMGDRASGAMFGVLKKAWS